MSDGSNEGGLYVEVFAEGEDDRLNLGCQFPCWGEDEGLCFALGGADGLQNGNGKGSCFSCSRLR